MGIAAWTVGALLVGALFRLSPPGRAMGWIPTLLLAVVGGLLGGLLASFLGFGGLSYFDFRGAVIAALTAALTLAAVALRRTRRSS